MVLKLLMPKILVLKALTCIGYMYSRDTNIGIIYTKSNYISDACIKSISISSNNTTKHLEIYFINSYYSTL